MSLDVLLMIKGGGTHDRSPYAYEEQVLYATVLPLHAQAVRGATYEWKIGDRIVNTGTDATYRPDDADIGQVITVSAIVPDPSGAGSIRFGSGNVKAVVGTNDPATGTLDVSIVPLGAERKYVAIDHIKDEDGRGPMSYQWLVDGKPIAGANGSEFTLAQAGGEQAVTLHGTYIDALGRFTTVVAGRAPVHADAPGTVGVTGTVAPNGVLRVNAFDPDGIVVSHFAWDTLDADGFWRPVQGASGPELALGASAPRAVRSFFDYADAGGSVFQRATVIGTDGADDIRASEGMNETIQAGGGNDIIRNAIRVDGGAGLDTFMTDWGLRLFYQAPGQPGVWHAESTLADTTSILANVERVQWSGGAVALDIDGTAGQAFRLYEAAFDRTADPVGLGFWISRMDGGVSLETIAEAFAASPEFKALYGANPGNAGIVAKFYANILDRAPDATGVAFWNQALDTGAATLAEVLVAFSESAENIAALVGAVANGIHYTPYAGA